MHASHFRDTKPRELRSIFPSISYEFLRMFDKHGFRTGLILYNLSTLVNSHLFLCLSSGRPIISVQMATVFPFRFYLALLGLILFILPPVTPLAVDAQSSLPLGPESTSTAILGIDENESMWLQLIDDPGRPVPTKLPVPRGAPPLIDTGYSFKVNAGKPFSIKLYTFIKVLGDVIQVNTVPAVSWVTLAPTKRSLTGLVPKDYPASQITVTLTVRYTPGAIGEKVIDLDFSVTLEVHRSVSISAPMSNLTRTVRPTDPATSLLASIPTTTRTTSVFPTTASATARTTLVAGLPFQIPAAPFLRNATDCVKILRTKPVSPWVGFTNSNLNQTLVGVVPADLPDTTVAVTLVVVSSDLQGYTVTLNVVIRAADSFKPSSRAATPLATPKTIPTAFPNQSLVQRKNFSIKLDPYKRYNGDVVASLSTEPQSDWMGFNVQPFLPDFGPTALQGTVPETQPPEPMTATLSIYSRVTGFTYTVPFTIAVHALMHPL